jgi:hypothetical protein
MMGAPWFPLYAGDLLADSKIRLLTDDQLGKLLKLWAFNCKDGSIPSDLAIASRLLGNCKPKTIAWINDFFVPDPFDSSRMFSPRMKKDHDDYLSKCAKLRVNASAGGFKKASNLAIAKANGVANTLAKPAESQSQSQRDTTVAATAATAPPNGKRSTKNKPIQIEPTLDEILGGRDSKNAERFWKFAGIWPKERNPAPKSLARAWNAACARDEPVRIYHGALNYRDGFLPPRREKDETQFMKAPLAWLQEEGWQAQIETKEATNA